MEKELEFDTMRADIYQLLAALLINHPSEELLDFLKTLEIEVSDSPLTKAWSALKDAAKTANLNDLENEYFNVFIGVGKGDVLPYGSWFITGYLMDKPLVYLREDLASLGYVRDDNVKEPEDHVAALFEVMGSLILDKAPCEQLAFYNRHLKSWILKFFKMVIDAKNANFYIAVGKVGLEFMELESQHFAQLALDKQASDMMAKAKEEL